MLDNHMIFAGMSTHLERLTVLRRELCGVFARRADTAQSRLNSSFCLNSGFFLFLSFCTLARFPSSFSNHHSACYLLLLMLFWIYIHRDYSNSHLWLKLPGWWGSLSGRYCVQIGGKPGRTAGSAVQGGELILVDKTLADRRPCQTLRGPRPVKELQARSEGPDIRRAQRAACSEEQGEHSTQTRHFTGGEARLFKLPEPFHTFTQRRDARIHSWFFPLDQHVTSLKEKQFQWEKRRK